MTPTFDILRSAFEGSASIRAGEAADAIDGVLPRSVAEPESSEALAAMLAWASREGASVVLRGRGTRLGCGRTPRSIDIVVSLRRLNRVLAHPHGDLTATIEAGATIGDVNRELARHRQWLPIDAADDDATIGGAIATNESGPLRHRHGTPRDLLIGVHLAMTDGRIVKAGGNVVKNVAGYDLGKLLSGSFGSLAAIATATFKLAPLPGASATVIATFRDSDATARAAAAVNVSQLEPAAFEVHVGRSYRLVMQFASTPAAIDAQVGDVRRLLAADSFDLVAGDAERDLWRGHMRAVWAAPGVIVRASWLPATLPAVLTLVDEIGGQRAGAIEIVGRAGVGAGIIRIDGDHAWSVAAVERLRAQSDLLGHVVLLRASPAVKQQVDVWGPARDHAALAGAVKRTFDPAGILNAGRGPI